MGVIVRQSAKYSLLNYLGAILGILSTLFVYPLALESYGMVRWFVDIAALAAPFVMLGANVLAVKYYPDFFTDKDEGHNPLLGLLIVWVLVGLLLFSILWVVLDPWISDFFMQQSEARQAYYPVLFPLTVSVLLGMLFTQYASNFKRIVIPSFLQEILVKISMPLLLLGVIYWSWSLDILVYGILLNYILAALGLLLYLRGLGAFRDLRFRAPMSQVRLKPMISYAFFGLLSSIGAILALRIDRVMVGYMLGDRINGIFSIVVTLGIFLEIPFRSVLKISSPLVAKGLAENELREVEHIYKRSSLALTLVGAVLFTGIWWMIDEVFLLMPNGDAIAAGKYVIFFYGLSVWINMITSVNGEIIGFSPYYRINFYAFLFLAVLNVLMNWVFITWYGMVGASIATLVSMVLFNGLKSVFIWWKYRIHPFSKETALTFVLTSVCWLGLALFPGGMSPWLSLFLTGLFILICFGAGVIWLNLSPELVSVVRDPVSVFFPGKKRP